MTDVISGPIGVPSADNVEDWGDPKRLHHSQEAVNGGNSIKYADSLPQEVLGVEVAVILPDPEPLRGVAALHKYRGM